MGRTTIAFHSQEPGKSGALWKRIKSLATKHRDCSTVAVAYFGTGGAKRLPLRKGSRLVVDMSPPQVEGGATNPKELLELFNDGVEIFSVSGLHAKVFVFGDTLVGGSCNASKASEESLIEAGIETNNPAVVKRAREFVHRLCSASKPLTEAAIRKAAANYGSRNRFTRKRYWMIKLDPLNLSKNESKFDSEKKPIAKRRLGESEDIDPSCPIVWADSSIHENDEIIQLYEGKVYTPARVVYTAPYGKKWQFIYVTEEQPVCKVDQYCVVVGHKNVDDFMKDCLKRLGPKEFRYYAAACSLRA